MKKNTGRTTKFKGRKSVQYCRWLQSRQTGHHMQPINPGDMEDADSITCPGDSPIGATGVTQS